MSLAVREKRSQAIAMVKMPMMMKVKPAQLAKPSPWVPSWRCASCGAATRTNRSNRSMIKPNAITAIAMRTQARKDALVGGVVAVALDHGKPRRGGECGYAKENHAFRHGLRAVNRYRYLLRNSSGRWRC